MAAQIYAYYRVSTLRQGESGLGLEAQRAAAKVFIESSSAVLLGEYIEVESGRRSDRPELSDALNACRKSGATLLIAKLDRLARNVHFISGLLESDVRFIAVDMPNADRFMLHVYAAMAEEEARRISERTKAALHAAKARGVELGKNGKILARKHAENAIDFSKEVGPKISNFKAEGLSMRKIADRLNADKITTYKGGKWYPATVQRTWKRYESLPTGEILNPLCR
ncbi:MAG TPA: recombinase family protein [Roseovarius sp.]